MQSKENKRTHGAGKVNPFSWTVTFSVAAIWIEDGFTMDATRAKAMLASVLPFAAPGELSATVVSAPSRLSIRQAQRQGLEG